MVGWSIKVRMRHEMVMIVRYVVAQDNQKTALLRPMTLSPSLTRPSFSSTMLRTNREKGHIHAMMRNKPSKSPTRPANVSVKCAGMGNGAARTANETFAWREDDMIHWSVQLWSDEKPEVMYWDQ